MTHTADTQMRELLPCPFCGARDGYVERYDYSSCYYMCNGCLARGPLKVIEDEDEEIPGHDPAVSAWNTRAHGEAVALDRAMLNDLMHAFDTESWVCPHCKYEDDCATMDSADMLREYLKTHPAAAVVVDEAMVERAFSAYWDNPEHDGFKAMRAALTAALKSAGRGGEDV